MNYLSLLIKNPLLKNMTLNIKAFIILLYILNINVIIIIIFDSIFILDLLK